MKNQQKSHDAYKFDLPWCIIIQNIDHWSSMNTCWKMDLIRKINNCWRLRLWKRPYGTKVASKKKMFKNGNNGGAVSYSATIRYFGNVINLFFHTSCSLEQSKTFLPSFGFASCWRRRSCTNFSHNNFLSCTFSISFLEQFSCLNMLTWISEWGSPKVISTRTHHWLNINKHIAVLYFHMWRYNCFNKAFQNRWRLSSYSYPISFMVSESGKTINSWRHTGVNMVNMYKYMYHKNLKLSLS